MADTCWDTHPELRELAQERSRLLRRKRRIANPVTQSAAFAEAMTNLGWVRDPNAAPPYPTPQAADSTNMWDVYDLGMVLQLEEELLPIAYHTHSIPMAVEDHCFAVAGRPFNRPRPVMVSARPSAGMWLIDSGASNHYTSMKHILNNFHLIPDIHIMTGRGFVTAKGIGNVTLHTSVGVRTVYDVMWVPALTGRHNLLSIPQLITKNCNIRMSAHGAAIYNAAGLLLVEGIFTGKGFLVKMVTGAPTESVSLQVPGIVTSHPVGSSHPVRTMNRGVTSQVAESLNPTAMLAGSSDTQPMEIWHMRLGHLNQAAIQQLATQATGLHIGPAKHPTVSMNCDSCLRGAQHKHISHARGPPADKLLEHIWSDLKGPLPVDADVYGFRFFIIFIDEKSRYTKAYPLLEKSNAFGAFKVFEARAERVTGNRIINLHVDGGGEFLSSEFRTHCRNRGIELCTTQAYSPEMNGIAERMIRTITEHASAMLWTAGLPIGFWAAAVRTAVFLTNRSPASALQGKTLFEAYFGYKPNLGFLKIWGCRAAAHVPPELRTKTDWASKSTPNCVFIGYSETENLYELWDVEKGCVIRKWDVVFWEHQMGHPAFIPVALPHGVSIGGSIEKRGTLSSSDSTQSAGDLGVDKGFGTDTNLAGAAAKLVPSLREDQNPPPTDVATTTTELPLPPLPARQSITKLPPEQTIKQRATAGELTFIPYVPPPAALNMQEDATMETVVPRQIPALQEAASPETGVPQQIPAPLATMEDDAAYAEWPSIFSFFAFHVTSIPLPTAPDITIPATYKEACLHPKSAHWRIAMEKELRSLRDNNTWELVPLPPGRRAFPNKWVFSHVVGPKVTEELERQTNLTPEMRARLESEGVMEKARLVARGDLQTPGVDYKETFAPVVKFVSLRVLLIYTSLRRFQTRHYDITSAFLHGDVDLEIYMRQPYGFEDGTTRVCKLNKAIYGLCQAARQFYKRLDDILTVIGYTRLAADWAIWFHADGAFIAVHVDDMFVAGSIEQMNAAYKELSSHLRLKDLGEMKKYLGLSIEFDQGVFRISQGHYARKILAEFDSMNVYTAPTPMVEGEKWDTEDSELLTPTLHERYRSAIGMLLYLMHGSRPDLSFAVIKLSQFSSKPRMIHWEGVKRVFRYLRGTLDRAVVLGVKYGAEPGMSDIAPRMMENALIGYFDAAHADNGNKRSTCGYLFTLYGGMISWATKVQKTIALSSTEAEYMSGTEATREAVWLKGLLDAIFHPKYSPYVLRWPIELRGDNQGALALANNPQFHQRTKHIELRHRFISDMVAKGIVRVTYVPTSDMLADSLTKPLRKELHKDHWQRLNLIDVITHDDAAHQLLVAMAQSMEAQQSRKRKWPCVECGNLFPNQTALKRHMLLKEVSGNSH